MPLIPQSEFRHKSLFNCFLECFVSTMASQKLSSEEIAKILNDEVLDSDSSPEDLASEDALSSDDGEIDEIVDYNETDEYDSDSHLDSEDVCILERSNDDALASATYK